MQKCNYVSILSSKFDLIYCHTNLASINLNVWMYACIHTGRLNVGDQLLVCDGVSLLEVTHDEAAQALKDAMDMESVRIQLSLPDSLRAKEA